MPFFDDGPTYKSEGGLEEMNKWREWASELTATFNEALDMHTADFKNREPGGQKTKSYKPKYKQLPDNDKQESALQL